MWSSSLGWLEMINAARSLLSPLLLLCFGVYFPTIATVSLQSKANIPMSLAECSPGAVQQGPRWQMVPDYSYRGLLLLFIEFKANPPLPPIEA